MNASNFVEGVDLTLYVILGISVFFLVGITAVMIYFLFRYRKKKNPVATNISHNNTLEIIWTIVPTILVLIMFWFIFLFQIQKKVIGFLGTHSET